MSLSVHVEWSTTPQRCCNCSSSAALPMVLFAAAALTFVPVCALHCPFSLFHCRAGAIDEWSRSWDLEAALSSRCGFGC